MTIYCENCDHSQRFWDATSDSEIKKEGWFITEDGVTYCESCQEYLEHLLEIAHANYLENLIKE